MVASAETAPSRLASPAPPCPSRCRRLPPLGPIQPGPYCSPCSWPPVVDEALSADLGFDKEFERFKAAAAQVRQGERRPAHGLAAACWHA